MNLREFVNNNSAVVTILAVVVLLVSLGIIVYNSSGRKTGPRIVDVYYYDLNTGQLFVGKNTDFPPIEAPSGPYKGKAGGVRAYVYSCGECSSDYAGKSAEQVQGEGAFIAWLSMYTPEAKAALTQAQSGDPKANPAAGMAVYEMYERGQVIKSLAGEKWVGTHTEQGLSVMNGLAKSCPDGRPKPCFPGR